MVKCTLFKTKATDKIIVEYKSKVIPDYDPHILLQNISHHLLVQDLIHRCPEVSK